MTRTNARAVLSLTPLALALSCAPAPLGALDGGADASALSDGAMPTSDASGDGALPDARVADAMSAPVLVYAHSRDTLYRFDPRTRSLSTVGTFDCITPMSDPADSSDGVTDLAIDRDGQMYAVGRVAGGSALVTVDPTTARCTRVAMITVEGNATEIQGLSFVPEGTFAPNVESLMGIGVAGAYFRIDRATGVSARIGTLGEGRDPRIDTRGGDFVSIAGGATYTIDNDGGTIYTFDPSTGRVLSAVPARGGVGDGWGMGYWGGTLYAFTFLGRIFAIDPTTGEGTEVPITNAPAGLSFRGAAVTTVAPLVAPP